MASIGRIAVGVVAARAERAVELVMFAPLLAAALWPRARRVSDQESA